MFGSNCSSPTEYKRAVVVDARAKEHDERRHSPEWTEECAQKEIDRVSVVRDVRFELCRELVDA
jgi:hypothetical protein